jgi:hypothetical protein
MSARKLMVFTWAAAVGLIVAAASTGAQSNGTSAVPAGFRVETLLMQLSSFLPEEYARLRSGLDGQAGPNGPGGPAQGAPRQGAQGPGAPRQGAQDGQRQGGFSLPQFKRDPKLMLTATQVDALLPVLQDLRKTPFPTPSQAKKVTTTVNATLTKQQKDAYDAYAKERDKAIEEIRKQIQSRPQGAQGGQGSAQGGQGAQGQGAQGQGEQTQRQMDPAELRKRMLDAFIRNLQDYRKGLT